MARSTASSKFALTRSASSIARNAALKPKATLTRVMPERHSGPAPLQAGPAFVLLAFSSLWFSAASVYLALTSIVETLDCSQLTGLWTGTGSNS